MAAKKNALVMLMVLNQLLIISSAKAEEEPELKRTPRREAVKNDRLHFLATLPVYIVTVGSVIHEGSHAVVVGLDDDFTLVTFSPIHTFIHKRVLLAVLLMSDALS